jgi:hypothetical protein
VQQLDGARGRAERVGDDPPIVQGERGPGLAVDAGDEGLAARSGRAESSAASLASEGRSASAARRMTTAK